MDNQDNSHFRYSLLLKEIDNLRSAEGVSAVAMVLIQLDGMEAVNERFGYLGGDKVLKEFAVRLVSVAGHKGLTFEIAGTAFAFLIQNPLHEGDAVTGAERIARVASEPVMIGTGKARLQARMGISLLRDSHGETYRVFTPSLTQAQGTGGNSWLDVDEAIAQGEFELHYQPKISLRSGRLIGAEALIRWQSPRAGTIPPSYFLPDITSTDSVRKMLKFVLNAALERAVKWHEALDDFVLAVNIAPQNALDPELYSLVEAALEAQNFPSERLILEISEDIFPGNEEAIGVQCARLRKLGIRIAIDDFGTGYFSLAALKTLPVDQLKIHQSLVVPIPSNETDRRMVGAVIQLAHAVNLEVIAEGIEDADIMQALLAIGCEIGEGFHFSRPIPADEFESEWISKFSNRRVVTA
jgi:EAL domain-containing protein (putative c-di-GMP-specific phosphodiesterase class I)